VKVIDEAEQIAHSDRDFRYDHVLKSWPELFEPLLQGTKVHDLRIALDRNFQVGESIKYREFDPRVDAYTGRECAAVITYITSAEVPCAFFERAISPEYCILSVRLLQDS
jgi:hypothetical protein